MMQHAYVLGEVFALLNQEPEIPMSDFTMPGLLYLSSFTRPWLMVQVLSCPEVSSKPCIVCLEKSSRSQTRSGLLYVGLSKFNGQPYYACLSPLFRNYNTGIERLCFPLSKAHCLCRHVSLEKSLLWKSTWNSAISGLAFLPDSST
jgi:hypothetical protein